MSRYLGPVDYGILVSLLSIFLIVSIPVSSLQAITSRSVAVLRAKGRLDEIKRFFIFLFKRLCICAVSVTILLIVFSPAIRDFLHLPGTGPIIILGISLFFVLIWPLFLGILQGLEYFIRMGINIFVSTISRLASGIILVLCNLGVNGAILATGISAFTGIMLSLIPRGKETLSFCLEPRCGGSSGEKKIDGKSETIFFQDIRQTLLPILAAFFCFTVITNIDVFLVRHFFKPAIAGYYGVASLIGKIIFYISAPVVMIVFPKLTLLHHQARPDITVLKKGFYIIAIISAVLIILYFLFPCLFIGIVTGKQYLPAAPLIGLYGVAAAVFSFSYLFLFYHISRERFDFIMPLAVIMTLEIILISIFHTDLKQVLFILIGSGTGLFLWNIILVHRGLKKA